MFKFLISSVFATTLLLPSYSFAKGGFSGGARSSFSGSRSSSSYKSSSAKTNTATTNSKPTFLFFGGSRSDDDCKDLKKKSKKDCK